MRRISGLDKLLKATGRPSNNAQWAELLKTDLKDCRLSIYGQRQGQAIVIAEMHLIEDGLSYDQFDQRIDLIVAGELLATEVPVHYALQGKAILMTGRCSLLAQVCGADLLLNNSFTGCVIGGEVRQKISIPIKSAGQAWLNLNQRFWAEGL